MSDTDIAIEYRRLVNEGATFFDRRCAELRARMLDSGIVWRTIRLLDLREAGAAFDDNAADHISQSAPLRPKAARALPMMRFHRSSDGRCMRRKDKLFQVFRFSSAQRNASGAAPGLCCVTECTRCGSQHLNGNMIPRSGAEHCQQGRIRQDGGRRQGAGHSVDCRAS
jgi:hypothetical protein